MVSAQVVGPWADQEAFREHSTVVSDGIPSAEPVVFGVALTPGVWSVGGPIGGIRGLISPT